MTSNEENLTVSSVNGGVFVEPVGQIEYYSVYIINGVASIKKEKSYIVNNNYYGFEIDTSIFKKKFYNISTKLTVVVYCNYIHFKSGTKNYEASIYSCDDDYRDKYISLSFEDANKIINIINHH